MQNPKYLTRPVICTIRRNIGTYKEYTNEDPKQAPELNNMELDFLNSSNDTISGDLGEIPPDHNFFQGR